MDCSPLRPSVCRKFSRQENRSGLPCPSPGDLPNPGIKSTSLMSPPLSSKFLTTWTTWEAHVVVVQLLNHVQLFVSPWNALHEASLSFTITQTLLKLMSTELVMPYNHLILCHPLLLLPSIFPSIRVFSNESALCIRWPNYWSFSISPSNEYSGLISSRVDWFDLHVHKGLSKVFSSTTIQKHQFFSPQPSLWSNYHIRTWLLEKP